MSSISVAGDTSGSISITAPLVAGSGVLTLPVATDTLVGKATTDTLTNKSIAVTQLTGTLPVANGGTGVTTSTGSGANVLGTSPSISGAVMTTMASSVITSGTSQASTSGTSIDFTGIPSWVKRVTVMFNGVSTNGTSYFLIQIGSGSVTTSGYTSACSTITSTAGFVQVDSITAANVFYGYSPILLFSGTTYISNAAIQRYGATDGISAGVSPALSGALDRVRITTVNGTDTFDAGSINILYE